MKYFKHLILVILLILIDFITKLYFKGKNIEISKYFGFNYSQNTGISFGLLNGNNLIFILITLIIIGLVIYYYKKEKRLQLGLDFILAGALGNLIDRISYGFVVDFINFKVWPVFNLADSFVVVGVLICLYKNFKK